jgi:hypothetical protein
MVQLIPGALFQGLCAFLLPFALTMVGFFRFDNRAAFWGFSLGFGFGIALYPFVEVQVSNAVRRLAEPLGGAPYINLHAMGRLLFAFRAKLMHQAPVADMNMVIFLMDWDRLPVPTARRFRYAALFAMPPFIEIAIGLSCLWISWPYRLGIDFASQFLFTSLGMLGLYAVFRATGQVLPIRTRARISMSLQAIQIWVGGVEFDRHRDRVLAFQIETLSSWRPSIKDPAVDRLHSDLMRAGDLTPSAASATFAGIRGHYVAALGRRQ